MGANRIMQTISAHAFLLSASNWTLRSAISIDCAFSFVTGISPLFCRRADALCRLTAGCGKGLESEHVANPGLVLVEGDIVFPPNNDRTIKKPGKC